MVLAYAYNSMLRNTGFPKWFRDFSSCGALFHGIGGFFVMTALARKKRWWLAALSLASFIIGGVNLLVVYDFVILQYSPYNMWIAFWIGICALIIAIIGLPDKHKLKRYCFLPLAATILLICCLRIYNAKLNSDIWRSRMEISQMLGRSIELSDFWERQNQGFPLNAEPLSSLIRHEDGAESLDVLHTQAEREKMWEEYQKNHPEFLKALNEFVKLPVQSIRHDYTDDILAGMTLPELKPFRTAARALALRMAANADKPQIVRECNAGMIKIRDWCLVDFAIIPRLVAISIENIRLNALAIPLAAETFRTDEWPELLGTPPEWGKALADSMGDEVTIFESLYNMITQLNSLETKSETIKINLMHKTVHKQIPLLMVIHFQHDYLFALNEYKKLELFLNLAGSSAMERKRLAEMDEDSASKNLYFISKMVIPRYERLHMWRGEVEDSRRMLEIAIAVMEYRKQHGKLPESLDFLPQKPLDSIDGNPICYEQGELEIMDQDKQVQKRHGFRLFLPYNRGGKLITAGIDAKINLTVLCKPFAK
ncbi:MAG: hypothetical protein JXR78_04765 [Victivallales bacterium]|nr:hypothetical protein [Victivallales bacterium]